MNELIGCCGKDCEQCEIRIATVTDSDVLRKKVAINWSKWMKKPITRDMVNCDGCRVNGRKSAGYYQICPVRQCVEDCGYSHCGECYELESCDTFDQNSYEDKTEYVKRLKE